MVGGTCDPVGVLLPVLLLLAAAGAGVGAAPLFGLEAELAERSALLAHDAGLPRAAWTHPLGEPVEDASKRPRPRSAHPTAQQSLPGTCPVDISFLGAPPSNAVAPPGTAAGAGSWPDLPGPGWGGAARCIDDGEHAGVPVGGMGAGSIGQTYRGDFRRWHLRVGHHHAESAPGAFFAVHVAPGPPPPPGARSRGHATALTAVGAPPGAPMATVGPRLPGGGEGGTYHALFPRAWRVFDPLGLGAARGAPPVLLTQVQTTPVIPHDYENSSLPVGVYEFWAENPSAQEEVTVSFLMSWENMLGAPFWSPKASPALGARLSNACEAAGGGVEGAVLTRRWGGGDPVEDYQGTMAIATEGGGGGDGVEVFCQPAFDARGNGSDVWDRFARDGTVGGGPPAPPAVPGAALAVRVRIPPGGRRRVAFALAWDLPLVRFGRAAFAKRYTERWGRGGRRALDLAAEALRLRDDWGRRVDTWQAGVLSDAGGAGRPEWYKQALFVRRGPSPLILSFRV